MARSINNGTGEIQIGTGGILEYPTNAYLRRSFYVPLSRAQLVALLVPRSTITRLRTDERVCATATVSTPFSPRQNPFFHGWNMWEGGGGRPPRGIILNYVCPRLVTGRSSQPNRALFLRSSPLSTFAGSFPPSSFRGSPILPAAPFTRTQKRFFDSKRWSSSRRMRLVDLRSTTSFLLFHPCPSFDLTAEIFLEIREGGVFRSRITPRRYFER